MGVGGLRDCRDRLGSDGWRVDSCSPGEVFRGDKRVWTSMGVAAAGACSVVAFSGDCGYRRTCCSESLSAGIGSQ